jgi:hypothetical protein
VRFPFAKGFYAAVLLTTLAALCAAQAPLEKTVEPEAFGAFFYLDSSAGTLKQLPREDFRRHTSTGFSTVTQSVMVSGEASPFHVTGDAQPTFVFKVFKDEEAARAKLFQFNIKGSDREYDLSKWHHKESTTNTGLPLNIAKFGQASFKVTPESPLAPGEYALTLGPTVFTFSVSGK